MSDPRPYDLELPAERRRLLRECEGYIRVSRKCKLRNTILAEDGLTMALRHGAPGFSPGPAVRPKSAADGWPEMQSPANFRWLVRRVLVLLRRAQGRWQDGTDRAGREFAIAALEHVAKNGMGDL